MRTLVVLLVLICGNESIACSPRRVPQTLAAGEYAAVVVAEVTGVRLTDYEDYKTGKIELLPDTRGSFVVNAWVERILDGKARSIIEVRLGGCLQSTPRLHERGLFLVPVDGVFAHAVWESDSLQYPQLLDAAQRIRTGH
jgi:hypothetical protein